MKNDIFLSNISDVLTELGPVDNLAPIQNGVKLLSNFSPSLFVDLFIGKEELNNNSHPIWKLIPKKNNTNFECGNYAIRLYTNESTPIKKIGFPQAAIGLIVLDSELLNEETLLYNLKRNSSQYSVLIILNYLNNDENARKLKYDFYGKFSIIDMASLTETGLSELLDTVILDDQKENLKKRCYLNTIQPLFQLTKDMIAQEQHIAIVRKNINSQLSNALRKEEAGGNISDTINTIKTQLQYWNSDTEKMIKIKYEELNKPMTGRYSQELSKWSDMLDDIERKEVAEKAERLVTSIDEKFLSNFEKKISKEVSSDFADDYNELLTTADTTLSNLNSLLLQKGITNSTKQALSIDYSRFPNPEKTIKNYIGFTRSYSGELGKKGASEYFAALREHTGSIMVAVGLLAPLNMISSAASGEASEDKHGTFAQISAFFKHMNDGIRMATAVVIIIMIVWGYFDLRERIPRKRQEEFERELKKARENIQTEGKRMFNETSKDWQNNVSMWLREAYTQLQSQLEKLIRDYSTELQKKSNDEKNRIQLLNQSLDTNSKSITNADRILDNTIRSHKDAVGDIEKSFR